MKVVVANYRTGSTTFAKSIGGDGNKHFLSSHQLVIRSPVKSNRPMTDSEITVFKIMPDHWDYDTHWHDFKLLYLNPAKEIHICLRKNFNEQVSSLIYGSITSDWHPPIQGLGEPGEQMVMTKEEATKWASSCSGGALVSNDILEKNGGEMGADDIKYHTDIIVKNLEWQSKVYKEFDTTLHWLEDRYDETVKYTRRMNIDLPELDLGINVRDYF